ncbi:trace amine-associated receptor 13c-like [Nerophis lumbriciformis]|uniref:trace amine-associated receptor 13c-like n=1 Tax=Nerophis lumbriciformis TaxID=546530 RepID=UPI002AE033D8|nr:trace amine-associated receptor 13c-like [Nerophis lumbriciformis]
MESAGASELCYPHLNASCRVPRKPPMQALLIYVLLSSISMVTVALNGLVIFSISYFRQLHTPTNLLLLSLAVSDLLVGALLMPVEIMYTEACWFLGDVACTLYYVADYVITSASVANMVLISVDRYVAICHPLSYPGRVTKRRVKICVGLCWLCSMVYRLVLLNEHLEEPGRSISCLGECVVVIANAAGSADLVMTFFLPILVILVLYLRVFGVAVAQAHVMRSRVGAGHVLRVKKSEMKAARTLGIVVLVFLICFCPYYFPTLAGENTSVDAASATFEIWLAHFNSCLNPFIYALFYPWFRKAVKRVFTLQILKAGSRDANIL